MTETSCYREELCLQQCKRTRSERWQARDKTVTRLLDSITVYLQRLLTPGLPWELKRTEKGLGLHVKYDCAVTLQTLTELLGGAEIVELTDEQ